MIVQVLLEANVNTGLDVQDIYQGRCQFGAKGKELKAVTRTRNHKRKVVSGAG